MTTRFILIKPSHPGNVGAAARAIKVMGFDELVLVDPRYANVLRRKETIERASGATDVLEKTRIVTSFHEATEGLDHLCATVMVPRDFGPPTYDLRSHLENTEHSTHIGFVFGCERFGLENEIVYQCHAALRIPTSPQFGSLNLAAAIQVVAYEWRMHLGGFHENTVTQPTTEWADIQAIQGTLTHWEQALIHLQFLNPNAPKKLMPRLTQLLLRAQLKVEEVHILRGIAKAILKKPRIPSP